MARSVSLLDTVDWVGRVNSTKLVNTNKCSVKVETIEYLYLFYVTKKVKFIIPHLKRKKTD